MALFPTTAGVGFSRTVTFSVQTTQAGENQSWRYRKQLRPRSTFGLLWNNITQAEAQDFIDFLSSVEGPHQTFSFVPWRAFRERWVPVGTGDGATQTFTLPGMAVTDLEMFINGVTPVNYSAITPGAGPVGEDTVTLVSPPAVDVPISCSFLGMRRFTVRFQSDKQQMPKLLPMVTACSFATTLQEAK
jgi:hypothetical protein